MAGKGDKWRKGTNLKAYWDNFDRIFRKSEMSDDDRKEYENDKESMSYSEFSKIIHKDGDFIHPNKR